MVIANLQPKAVDQSVIIYIMFMRLPPPKLTHLGQNGRSGPGTSAGAFLLKPSETGLGVLSERTGVVGDFVDRLRINHLHRA
jgi:hypothetical protein